MITDGAILPAKYVKKPIVVEAIQWRVKNIAEIRAFCPQVRRDIHYLFIDTLEGMMRVNPFDWIIKGLADEFYPCKPEIFERTYDRA